ncbi:MAG TPA: response regulator transcription factor [Puia sp.]|nr:response regulator transcription factor [Puia sp.]
MLSIAIIEESAEFAFVLANYLGKLNGVKVNSVYHFLHQARNGFKGLPVDIAIIDVKQHNGFAFDFIKEMIENGNNTRFLVFSMSHDDKTVFHALDAGAQGYLLKDSSLEKLADAIIELSVGGAPMSAVISGKLLAYYSSKQRKEMKCEVLSMREKEIMRQVSRGLVYKEIASRLGIQRETVKKHVANIYIKLKVQNRVEAINKFFGQ